MPRRTGMFATEFGISEKTWNGKCWVLRYTSRLAGSHSFCGNGGENRWLRCLRHTSQIAKNLARNVQPAVDDVRLRADPLNDRKIELTRSVCDRFRNQRKKVERKVLGVALRSLPDFSSFVLRRRLGELPARMFATRGGNSENSWQQMCAAPATSVRPPLCPGHRNCLRHIEETAKKSHPTFMSVPSSYRLLRLTGNQRRNAASFRLLL